MKNDTIIAEYRYSAEHISLYHWLEKTEHVEKRIEAVDLTTFQASSNFRSALGTAMLTYHPEISKFKDYIPSNRAT